jgi:Outer membrane protein beta-barrel domain
MKGSSLLIILFIFSFPAASAQSFSAGLIGGLSTSQVAGDGLSGFNKAGVIVGGFVNTPLSPSALVQMEIVFMQKGSKKPYTAESGTFYVMRLSYIEIPLLYKHVLTSKFMVEAGPSVGVLVFSEEEDEYGIEEGRPPFNTVDVSGCIGLNYSLSKNWTFNTRFSNSVIPIRPYESGFSFANFDRGQYNTVLAFTFHYRF